jgi:predicted ATPase/class 3 adenylate cyclase
MFCDLVDSTGITSRLDAEEWRDLVDAYLNAASAAVTEMGGKVAKKLGDGLMALFGYPLAQENDAERAVRAALAIQRSLAELNRKNASFGKPALAARIAIDLGPVVVDATGEIFGDVPNVAARAQALAEPGSVVVTARVQRQIAGLFVAEERGSHELKGVPEPVTLFRLVRASGGGRRAGQRHLTPLVGREEEIAMLMRRWERARQGDGQLVLIVGEPGLGKSRLIEEFHSRLRETPHTWVEWSCSQLLQNTPLHPIVEWGRQRFGGADVPAEQRLADLESTLTQVKLGSAESASLLAPLLDIPLSSERSVELVPEELRRRQMAALTNWVMAGARAQPIVLAIEDAHWADPTTLELLRGIAERGALAPLLVVITARQEFRPAWGVRSHHATISLVPLDRAQVRDMVSGLAARHALSKEVIEGMTERTGGVPLFVEEVTRLLLERGEQGGVQAIPPTLQQSLTARLDRLGSAREVAQIGAVIGRDFSYGLLRDVAGIADAALEAALERLADADILLVLGLPPDSDYRFKHALIQDAAYENLLKSRRQALHRRVAETLRDRFADSATAEPEALAHHFTQAGMTDAAIEWWGKAGDQALRRSAFQEAISHLGKAIEMADKAEEDAPRAAPTPAAAEQRLKLQTVYANALIHARGHGAPETSAAFAKAQTLAAGLGEAADRFSAYYGRWVGSLNRCEPAIVQEAAAAFLRETELRPDSPEAGVAYRISGLTRLYFGDYAEARANIEKALAILKSERDRELAFRFGQDQVAAAMIYMALVLWPLGDVELARQFADQAASQAAKSGNLQTLAYVNYHLCLFEALRGDRERAVPVAKAVLDLAHERAMPIWESAGRLLHGWANWLVGDQRMELAEMRRGIERWRELEQIPVDFTHSLHA